MENATKALLIAAAVIVAILIISLGIGIFTRAQEQVDSGDLTEYQVTQFNSKFEKYKGSTVSGSDVNALLSVAFNHNNAQDNTDTCVLVKLSTKSVVAKSNELTISPDKVSTGKKYKVSLTYSSDTGLVTEINITEST